MSAAFKIHIKLQKTRTQKLGSRLNKSTVALPLNISSQDLTHIHKFKGIHPYIYIWMYIYIYIHALM